MSLYKIYTIIIDTVLFCESSAVHITATVSSDLGLVENKVFKSVLTAHTARRFDIPFFSRMPCDVISCKTSITG